MEPVYDNGLIIKLKGNNKEKDPIERVVYNHTIGSNKELNFKELNLTKYDGKKVLHITDYSKCWASGVYKKEVGKTVTLKLDQIFKLGKCIEEIDLYAEQLGLPKVRGLSG